MSDSKLISIDGQNYLDAFDSSIDQAQEAIEDEFGLFDDWMDRYQYLIDLGKALPAMESERLTEDRKVSGCQSQVWIDHAWKDGRLYLHANSDALIVSGLISLLLRVYSGRSSEEIRQSEPRFIKTLGLDSHLSPTRSNGLVAMLEAIHSSAASG